MSTPRHAPQPSPASHRPPAGSRRAQATVALAVGLVLAHAARSVTPPVLPVPCAAGNCGAKGPGTFVTSGSAGQPVTQGSQLTVNQTSQNAILNWSSFNIGAGGKVVFNQPGANSIALNRIYQANPSAIFGQLTANGQLYLINLNGFLFGKGAVVNTNGLLVSSLPMSDATFKSGILAPLANNVPALGSLATDTDATYGTTAGDPFVPYGSVRTDVLDGAGKPVVDANGLPIPVGVTVEQGAALTAPGARVLLAGQNVTNAGTVTTAGGQAVLAAGERVYLQASSDPALRGLLVEVDAGGKAWNQVSGAISADRGNVSLVGLAVNQEGRLSATTSVSANGSILLTAGDTHKLGGSSDTPTVVATRGGKLTIGPTSDIEVLPELSSTATAVETSLPYASNVTLLGQQVLLNGGKIVAPSGNLAVTAASDPSIGVVATGDTGARLRVDAGTTIDLSGSTVTLPVSANLVTAQLRANELADDPNQRNGALRGQTVIVDARAANGTGTPLSFANLTGYISAVARNVGQLTETGGSASFTSGGDVVVSSGATINVSGGRTNYQGGVIQTSYLVGADGALYPIATADPLKTYVGVVNPTLSLTVDKWGVQEVVPTPGLSSYQAGYVQGASAGTVSVTAGSAVLNGTLLGNAVNGPYQRGAIGTGVGNSVAGGRLVIGSTALAALPDGSVDFLSPSVTFTSTPVTVAVGEDAPYQASTLNLPTQYLSTGGFTRTEIYSNGGVTLPAGTPLGLPPGSSMFVNANRIDLLSGITAPGGSLTFEAVRTSHYSQDPLQPRSGVYLGDDVTLDVRGQWTNDLLANGALVPTFQGGGSVVLGLATTSSAVGAVGVQGGEIALGNNDAFHVSGGAWLNAAGTLTGGAGGTLAINAGTAGGGLALGRNLAIDGFGVNGAAGGTFTLGAQRLVIGPGTGGGWTSGPQLVDDLTGPQTGAIAVNAGLFSDYGFSKFALNAAGVRQLNATAGDTLTVLPGTTINAIAESEVLNAGYLGTASASNIEPISSVATLAPGQRTPVSLALSARPSVLGLPPAGLAPHTTVVGDLTLGQGATVTTDAGGSVTLSGAGSVLVDGAIHAPGGSITLQTVGAGPYEEGYLPNQRIELGSSALLDVSGAFVPKAGNSQLLQGSVLGGGAVTLQAGRGAVYTDGGSQIDLAGASAPVDVAAAGGGYVREQQASAAGSLVVRSGQAVSLLGAIDGAAGVGSEGALAGASVSLYLSRDYGAWWVPPSGSLAASGFNTAPLSVALVDDAVGSYVVGTNANLAPVNLQALVRDGVDSVSLYASGTINFKGSAPVQLGRQLSLDAPLFVADSTVNAAYSAPYLSVGFANSQGVKFTSTAAAGTGIVALFGTDIDVIGHSAWAGAGALTLNSAGDLRLVGSYDSTASYHLSGALDVGGNLTLGSARTYAVTGTAFEFTAGKVNGGQSITLSQTGSDLLTPLSAGSALTFTADTILADGTVYAPFGTITMNGAKSVEVGAGALLSVSGAGLTIPFGQTEFGALNWIYSYSGAAAVTGLPDRRVTLTSATVKLDAGSTVDVRGGGDLQAYEWVPGAGGTTDALAGSGGQGRYAILPSLANQLWPADPQEAFAGVNTGPNTTIYWSGGGGLAAGTYALLPARYALLPGAFLVSLQSSVTSPTGGRLTQLADGTPVVGAYLGYGGTALQAGNGYQGFAIYPGSYAQQLASYTLSEASAYFAPTSDQIAAGAARAAQTVDGGTLVLAAGATFAAEGLVKSAAATGGRAATVDLSTADLYVGRASDAPAGAAVVSDTVLDSWKAGSIVLGGTSTSTGINVTANTVTVGAGAVVTADEVVLVAANAIDLKAGSLVESTSAGSGGTAPATAPVATSLALSGAGNGKAALVAVSDLELPTVVRAAGSGSGAGGASILLEGAANGLAAASLGSKGAVSIDGPGSTLLNGTISGTGAAWSLAASSIAVSSGTTSADALTISPALLAQLNQAGSVRLASSGALDLDTRTVLGLPAGTDSADGVSAAAALPLTSITLLASAINNGAAGGEGVNHSVFAAKTVTLSGPGSSPGAAAAATDGSSLSLVAGTLDIGPGALSVSGFGSTSAKVFGDVVGVGTGSLTAGGALNVAAREITVQTGAETALVASGAFTVSELSTAGTPAAYLGGSLALSGASLDVGGVVRAASGVLSLTATGGVSVRDGAELSTAGTSTTIGNRTVVSPGGALSVTAGESLLLAAGSTVDVSGGSGANAGRATLGAGGSADVEATLKGAASGTAQGGSFALSAGTLGGATSLDTLSAALGRGGFSQAIGLRVHSGNLLLDAGQTLGAHAVSVAADTGTLTVAGTVSTPSGNLRGTMALFGGAGFDLAASGVLRAEGSGAGGRGGLIEIGTGELLVDGSGQATYSVPGSIRLEAGSLISTAGAAQNGRVLLRAPAVAGPDYVAISAIGSTFRGVGSLTIEPVLPFSTASFADPTKIQAGDWSTVQAAIGTYMNGAGPAIAGRLGGASLPPLVIQPGADIVATGSLTVNGDGNALDLSPGADNWRFGGAPVDLTIRAAGNLTVAAAISDGFDTNSDNGGTTQPVLSYGANAGNSASLRLVAGSDLSAANPLTVTSTGTLTVADDVVVRTGTGDINLAAGQDIVIGKICQKPPCGLGASVYTAGTPLVAAGGTAANPYQAFPTDLGTPTPYGIAPSPSNADAVFSFPTAGGNLSVSAGRDVLGNVLTDAGVPNWQLREGGVTYGRLDPATNTYVDTTVPAQWGVNLNAYNWNLGTLGGGDVSVSAGRDASHVTVAAAGSRVAGDLVAPVSQASGGLSLYTGRDLGSAQIFIADGAGSVISDGGVTAIQPVTVGGVKFNLGSVAYLQSSSLAVQARTGIVLEGAYNPTALGQPIVNNENLTNQQGSFFSYSADSALSLRSTGGDVAFGPHASTAVSVLIGPQVTDVDVSNAISLPASLSLEALTGSVRVGGAKSGFGESLYPSSTGNLTIVAARDITGSGFGLGGLSMSDSLPSTIGSVQDPLAVGSPIGLNLSGLIHAGDPNPVLIEAGRDISQLTINVPKAAEVYAGRDVSDFTLRAQNLAATDLTLIEAGRDVTYSDSCTVGCLVNVSGPGRLDVVAGRNINLAFSTGVTTDGNFTSPNLPATGGADLTMLAGAAAGPGYPAVVSNLISATDTVKDAAALAALPAQGSSGFNAGVDSFLSGVVQPSAAYSWELGYFVRNVAKSTSGSDPGPLDYAAAAARFKTLTGAQQQAFLTEMKELIPASTTGQKALAAFVAAQTGRTGLSVTDTFAAYAALGADSQRAFARSEFFDELTASGRDNNNLLSVGFARGNAAIDALFPMSRTASPDFVPDAFAGDLSLVFSRIYTLDGGNISLFAPGGAVNVGLAAPPPTLGTRPASQLGIVSEGAGDVSIYSRGDVLVNGSRIFTLGGGNILIWSNEGSIDAGRGAKSAISAPPPQITVGSDGTVKVSFSGAATGSGIRTIQTDPAQPLGNVDLVAPVGSVNAGDAGIGAAGNINIAAQHVLGLDNIQVGGSSTGVPAQVSSLGASLLGASTAAAGSSQAGSDAAQQAANEANKAAAPIADAALGWLDVFVTGLGDEACKPDDLECLKRQKKK